MNEKQDTEFALRSFEERFRALPEISSDWFWETDSGHRFTFFSLEVSVDLKYKRTDILGKTRWELFPDSMTPQEWEAHKKTQQTFQFADAAANGLWLKTQQTGKFAVHFRCFIY